MTTATRMRKARRDGYRLFAELQRKASKTEAPRVVAECWTCIRNIDGNPVPHSMSAPGEAFYHHTAGHDVREVTR